MLDNQFATLPYVVAEGRRVIGNIERVANLFLAKTVYSALLALLGGIECLLAKPLGADPLLYPFQPIHVTIAAWFTIGIPSFILSLAPNNERAYPGFVRRVLTSALPSGLVVGTATFVSYLAAYPGRHSTWQERTQASTAALITLLVTALWVLAVVARPYQWWRLGLVMASGAAYLVIFSLPLAQQKFFLDPSNLVVTSIALGIGVIGPGRSRRPGGFGPGCSASNRRYGGVRKSKRPRRQYGRKSKAWHTGLHVYKYFTFRGYLRMFFVSVYFCPKTRNSYRARRMLTGKSA
ncbi:putative membrane protein [Mycobacterium kansasii 732]|nr:putative membrane protein [Mycobacterium kansasii 732]